MAELDILVPHFNDVPGLAASLNCIAAQTWDGSMRVVVADDGSSSECLRQVEDLVEQSPLSITLICNETNRGRPYTRNVLLGALESKYAAWFDSGDEWYPDKIATQMARLATQIDRPSEGAKWISCHYDWRWGGGRSRQVHQRTNQDQVKALLFGQDLRAYLWTILCASSSLRDVGWFDERLGRLQDLDYFIRFALKGGIILDAGVPQSLCAYNKSDIGRDADEVRSCYEYIFDKHRTLYMRYGNKFAQECRYQMEMQAARFAMNNRKRTKSYRYMAKALAAKPARFLGHVRSRGLRP